MPYFKMVGESFLTTASDQDPWGELLRGFPHLQVLSLRGTNISDQTIETIGEVCPKLQSLDVSNTGITEKNLDLLPSTLKNLNIVGTGVIPFGVYQFLRSHLGIFKVEYNDMVEVCRCMQIMIEAEGEVSNVSYLRSLTWTYCKGVYDEMLRTCSQVFPNLEYLSILRSDLYKNLLNCICSWNNLRHLELGNSNFSQYTVYFHEHVAPVLQILGQKLLSLSLEKFKHVDVASIQQYCPHLAALKLSRILSYSNIEYNSDMQPFAELRELTILNSLGSRLTEPTLFYILNSQTLEMVSLQFITGSIVCYGDRQEREGVFLADLWKKLSLPELKVLKLEHCHSVTPAFIDNLISQDSNLESLHCYSCAPIGEEEKCSVLRKIRELNVDLAFDWSGCRLSSYNQDIDELEVADIENRAEFL